MANKKNEKSTLVMDVQNSRLDFRRDRYILIEIYGQNIGLRRDISNDTIILGRSHDCDIQLDDEGVSRRHMRIIKEKEKIIIEDLSSTNGTYVNDQMVSKPVVLNNGDRIKLGNTIFKFIWSDDMEADYYDTLYQYSIRDGLTGLFNKKYFQDALHQEFERARRYDRELALMMLDIDHFKQINDTYGHITGDRVLSMMGDLLKRLTRTNDCVARFGGEEFSIILPETDATSALIIAERTRVGISKIRCSYGNKEIGFTVSIGLALLSKSMTHPLELLKDADEKLYKAKDGGRNQVVN